MKNNRKSLTKLLPLIILVIIFFPAHKTGSALLELIYAGVAIIVLGYYIVIIIRKIKR